MTSGVNVASNGKVNATISGLSFNSEGFLAVKAIDNVGNIGPMSDSIAFAVKQVAMVAENRAETMDGTTAEGTWGLEASPARTGNVFSDTPTIKMLALSPTWWLHHALFHFPVPGNRIESA